MSIKKNEPMRVSQVMLPPDRFPVIGEREILKEALVAMGRSRLGIACIVDSDHKLLGILTDGDIRRKLLKVQKPFSAFFVDDALVHAIKSPVTIQPIHWYRRSS
jgi:arabinose-5-phosphate isomerase